MQKSCWGGVPKCVWSALSRTAFSTDPWIRTGGCGRSWRNPAHIQSSGLGLVLTLLWMAIGITSRTCWMTVIRNRTGSRMASSGSSTKRTFIKFHVLDLKDYTAIARYCHSLSRYFVFSTRSARGGALYWVQKRHKGFFVILNLLIIQHIVFHVRWCNSICKAFISFITLPYLRVCDRLQIVSSCEKCRSMCYCNL